MLITGVQPPGQAASPVFQDRLNESNLFFFTFCHSLHFPGLRPGTTSHFPWDSLQQAYIPSMRNAPAQTQLPSPQLTSCN